MTQNIPHNPLEGEKPEISINLHDGTEEQIAIVIVHKDRPDYLSMCLQSIAICSFNNNYEIIVVDNASGKEGQDFLNDIEGEVKVIRNQKNLYWSEAANKGVEAANKNAKYIVFLHCDVVIENPAWLDLMINVATVQNSGMVGVALSSFAVDGKTVPYVQEWLVMFTKECWNQIGPFPEQLPIIGPSFVLTLKAQSQGFAPQIMKNRLAHHYQIFSFDVSEYEREIDRATLRLPHLIRPTHSDPVLVS